MKITLPLEGDVAGALERFRGRKKCTLDQAVNEMIRRGFRAMEESSKSAAPYRTPSSFLGRCLLRTLDNVAEALAVFGEKGFR
jgi:hypothetical protein